jgi:hypothetical protein
MHKENLVYTHNEILLGLKNEILLFVPMWRNPKNIMLSEGSQALNDSAACPHSFMEDEINICFIGEVRRWSPSVSIHPSSLMFHLFPVILYLTSLIYFLQCPSSHYTHFC